MIKVKHLLDAVEDDDGQRIWVESIGLTLDLQEWCKIDMVLSQVGPTKQLWNWFSDHPQAYDYFRAQYHQGLDASPFKAALVELASSARSNNFTLIHQGDDPIQNTATALHEFLSELQAYAPPEAQ